MTIAISCYRLKTAKYVLRKHQCLYLPCFVIIWTQTVVIRKYASIVDGHLTQSLLALQSQKMNFQLDLMVTLFYLYCYYFKSCSIITLFIKSVIKIVPRALESETLCSNPNFLLSFFLQSSSCLCFCSLLTGWALSGVKGIITPPRKYILPHGSTLRPYSPYFFLP